MTQSIVQDARWLQTNKCEEATWLRANCIHEIQYQRNTPREVTVWRYKTDLAEDGSQLQLRIFPEGKVQVAVSDDTVQEDLGTFRPTRQPYHHLRLAITFMQGFVAGVNHFP